MTGDVHCVCKDTKA